MSETLEQIEIARAGRTATARAAFVFHQNGTSRRGRLTLTLVESKASLADRQPALHLLIDTSTNRSNDRRRDGAARRPR